MPVNPYFFYNILNLLYQCYVIENAARRSLIEAIELKTVYTHSAYRIMLP